jgi:3-hydroxyacyl-CoA dehydrogenase/enoyl-CoA hydratase/3-hydroxybutyryl-CoA epimerase
MGGKMTKKTYKHWQLDTDIDQILWLTLDRQGASVNSLSREVFDELDTALDEVESLKPKAMVLTSGKPKGFIAGADITQFTSLKSQEDALLLIRQAQIVLDKLEALTMPTVAMINGFCLGGGLEVALACRYRVAEDAPSTRIGLPEVKLGIHPGWGGTVRLPKLIGAMKAMSIMLPGAAISASAAKKIGMVDCAVPNRHLLRATRFYALRAPSPSGPKGLAQFSNVSWVRPLLGRLFERQLRNKVQEKHYPSPYAIVRNWVKEGLGENAQLTEAESIAKLMVTDNSRNMVAVFFLQEKLKSLAKSAKLSIKWVHVIGAGTMGGDIAAWCALKGFQVTLQDQTVERIAPAIKRANVLFKKKLKKPRLVQAVMDRLQPDVQGYGLKKADLVIEAIFEDLAAKQALYKTIEPQLKSTAIIASNTSSIPLDELNQSLKNPERLVGIHFFNPVSKMPLVEVVLGKKTSGDTQNQAKAFVGKIGKLPLPVSSKPGFLVNRVLMPYLMEAMMLANEGAALEAIDNAALDFGMPMGPIELADKVGLDVCLSVAENLLQHYGGELPNKLKQLVKDGHLGVKTGRGFYSYANGRKIVERSKEALHALPYMSDRMILRMLNESVACLEEGVVESKELLDAGMVFGTGFSPFRGGPMRYASSQGYQYIAERLAGFEKEYGKRFKPHSGWEKLTIKNKPIESKKIQKNKAEKKQVQKTDKETL